MRIDKITFLPFFAGIALSIGQSTATTANIDFGDKTTANATNITTNNAGKTLDLVGMQGKVQLQISKGELKNLTSDKEWYDFVPNTIPGHSYTDSELDGLFTVGDGSSTTPAADIVITFSGLSAGTYSMDILSAFAGKNHIGPNLTFTLTGSTGSLTNTAWSGLYNSSANKNNEWESKTETGNGISFPTYCPNKNESSTYCTQGAVANASNILVDENGTLTLTISSEKGWSPHNIINNIKLTNTSQPIPETSTATLSLLGLVGLALRRHRRA